MALSYPVHGYPDIGARWRRKPWPTRNGWVIVGDASVYLIRPQARPQTATLVREDDESVALTLPLSSLYDTYAPVTPCDLHKPDGESSAPHDWKVADGTEWWIPRQPGELRCKRCRRREYPRTEAS